MKVERGLILKEIKRVERRVFIVLVHRKSERMRERERSLEMFGRHSNVIF